MDSGVFQPIGHRIASIRGVQCRNAHNAGRPLIQYPRQVTFARIALMRYAMSSDCSRYFNVRGFGV